MGRLKYYIALVVEHDDDLNDFTCKCPSEILRAETAESMTFGWLETRQRAAVCDLSSAYRGSELQAERVVMQNSYTALIVAT